MTTSPELIQIETAPNPTATVIWLHGLGASGAQLAPLLPQLDLSACPPIRFILPSAPSMPVTFKGGAVVPAWYDLPSADSMAWEDEAGLRASQSVIHALIGAERMRGIRSERIVLAGFSQGCAMTLQTGLRYPEPLAGLICLSGYLPLRDTVVGERHAANQQTPVFMAHGTLDQVVPLTYAEASRDILTELDYLIDWHEYPIEHSVCAAEVIDIGRWLTRVLN